MYIKSRKAVEAAGDRTAIMLPPRDTRNYIKISLRVIRPALILTFQFLSLFLSRGLRPASLRKVREDCKLFPQICVFPFISRLGNIDHHSNFSIASASFTLTIAKFLPTRVSSNEPT